MKPAFWLFILFVLASGLSAWIGNEWGRLIGKRKLTVFALRPKHTSNFLTILLSIALSLGFLGVYLLADPSARETLLSPESSQERQLQLMQEQATDFNSTLQRIQHRVRLASTTSSSSSVTKPLVPGKQNLINQAANADSAVQIAQFPVFSSDSKSQIAKAPFAVASHESLITSQRPHNFQSQPLVIKQTTHLILEKALSPQSNQSTAIDASKLPLPRLAVQSHLAVPEPAKASPLLPNQKPVQLALLKAPIFQLRVYGGRNPAESRRIVAGVLDMTRAYARDLGLRAGIDPLQVQSLNLAQSHRALEKDQIYQLQVKVGQISNSTQLLPVKLVLKAEARLTHFDPQQLLEQARLNPESNLSLHTDLSQAILALAHETRQDFAFETMDYSPDSSRLAESPLSIRIMQLHRAGNTLQGQIVLLADATNLTEN